MRLLFAPIMVKLLDNLMPLVVDTFAVVAPLVTEDNPASLVAASLLTEDSPASSVVVTSLVVASSVVASYQAASYQAASYRAASSVVVGTFVAKASMVKRLQVIVEPLQLDATRNLSEYHHISSLCEQLTTIHLIHQVVS